MLFTDILIISILSLNTIYDTGLYVWQKYFMTPIELTAMQMKAFGVKPNELGFKECKPIICEQKSNTSTDSFPPFELSQVSDLDRHSSLNSTALSNGNISALSDGTSAQNSSLNTTSTSWVFERQLNPFLTTSPNSSTDEPINTSASGLVRLRKTNTKLNASDRCVTNEKDLSKYLKDFEEREERYEELLQAEKRQERNNSNTAWNTSPTQLSSVIDESNKTSYQFATDSPSRLNSTEFDSLHTSSSSSKAMDAVIYISIINYSSDSF